VKKHVSIGVLKYSTNRHLYLTLFACCFIYLISDSLSEAKLKANKATTTSELSSVDEEMYYKKQSKKNCSSSSLKNKSIYKSSPNYKKKIIKDVDKLYGVKSMYTKLLV